MKRMFTYAFIWMLIGIVIMVFFKHHIVSLFISAANLFGGAFRLFFTTIIAITILFFYIITFFSDYLFLRIGLPNQISFFSKSLFLTGLILGIFFGFSYVVIGGIILGVIGNACTGKPMR